MIPFTFSYFFISFIWHLYAVYKENRTLSSRLIVVNTLFSIFGYFLIVYSLSGGQLSFFRLSSHLFNFIKSLIFENHFYHLQSVEYFGLIFFGFLIFLPLVIYIVGKFSSVGGGRTQISSVDVAMPPREVIGNYLREITIKNFFVYLLWFLAVCLAVGISYLGCVVLPLWTQFCLGSSLNNIVLSVLQIFIIALFATIPISFILRLVDDSFFLKLYIKTTVLIVLIMFISLFISYEIGLLPRHNFYGGISVPVVPGISY